METAPTYTHAHTFSTTPASESCCYRSGMIQSIRVSIRGQKQLLGPSANSNYPTIPQYTLRNDLLNASFRDKHRHRSRYCAKLGAVFGELRSWWSQSGRWGVGVDVSEVGGRLLASRNKKQTPGLNTSHVQGILLLYDKCLPLPRLCRSFVLSG